MNQPYVFKLFVAGSSPRTAHLIEQVRDICYRAFGDSCSFNVIDVLENPGQAEADHILATPTLVRERPLPRRLIIGDLTHYDRLLRGLDIPIVANPQEQEKEQDS